MTRTLPSSCAITSGDVYKRQIIYSQVPTDYVDEIEYAGVAVSRNGPGYEAGTKGNSVGNVGPQDRGRSDGGQ